MENEKSHHVFSIVWIKGFQIGTVGNYSIQGQSAGSGRRATGKQGKPLTAFTHRKAHTATSLRPGFDSLVPRTHISGCFGNGNNPVFNPLTMKRIDKVYQRYFSKKTGKYHVLYRTGKRADGAWDVHLGMYDTLTAAEALTTGRLITPQDDKRHKNIRL